MTYYQRADGHQQEALSHNKLGGNTNRIKEWLLGEGNYNNIINNSLFTCYTNCLNPTKNNNFAAVDTGAAANYLIASVLGRAIEILHEPT